MLRLYWTAYLIYRVFTHEPEVDMFLKKGVNIQGMSTELLFGLNVADAVYKELGYELTVTSVLDGRHSLTSLHYAGNAADLRIRGISDPQAIVDMLKARLGVNFDVLLESNHIHIDYQPRNPK